MIRKLKRQFILINMSMVLVILLIGFTTIGWLSYDRLQMDSFIAMEKAVTREFGSVPPPMEFGDKEPERRGPLVPVFTVELDSYGQVIGVSRDNISVPDATVQSITEKVLSMRQDTGILFKEELRFLVRTTPNGTRIAFASMSHLFDTLSDLALNMVLVGLLGLCVFYVASVYLARWILKPVETAWEKQTQFVADASHELKTPLTVILANTSILLSHQDNTIAQQRKWVEHTQDEANRLKILVEDLLFLAKFDARQLPEMAPQISFSDILWQTLLPFESLAYDKGISIDMAIEPHVTLRGNEGQLKQLLVILMDNGIKYAGTHGCIKVALKSTEHTVSLSVSNSGAAIPTEQLSRLFDRFYRGDTARQREHGGYGLGLSIADSIVKTHGGNIHVESDLKAGTTFSISFPRN